VPVEVINGRKVHVQVLGAGPSVVMLHGMMVGSISTWYFAVAPALATYYRVLMYELRGHGMSEFAKSGYGMHTLAADLADVVDSRVDDGPFALVGHSYGAVVALRYALDHPGKVRRLVLVEPPLPVISAEWVEAFRSQSVEGILSALPPLLQAGLKKLGKRSLVLGAKLLRLSTQTTMKDDMMAEPDIADVELSTLTCPVLLCSGTRSHPVFAAASARLMLLLPDVRLVNIEGGHYLPEEAPAPLAHAIRAFLAD